METYRSKRLDGDGSFNPLEYQFEVYKLLENIVRRLENLLKVYEETARDRIPNIPRVNPAIGRSSPIYNMVELFNSLAASDLSRRFRRRINLLDGDPPCLICGKFQDKEICDSCREEYPILSSLMVE